MDREWGMLRHGLRERDDYSGDRLPSPQHGAAMACARRHLDRLRLPAAAGPWHRVDPRLAAEYLPVRPGGTPALAGRPQPVRTVGEFAAHHLYPRAGKLRISQALH